MADNQQPDNSGNIYVEFDYNNIILVDPNRTIDNQGRVYERLVDHENLIMFANLEAEVIPRTKLAIGFTPNDTIRNTTTIAKMNFLRPTKNTYLSAGYYDDLTGRNALQQQATNQPLQKVGTVPGTSRPYFENTVVDEQNVIDTGLLGITSINVKVSSSFIPSVTMELEDIQGKALFQLGNKSPYSAFFNLPYPQFYLTLKGYYGQAIKYQLNLEKFNARFNSATGNYSVSLEFRGFKFNILNEVLISHLFAAPHMYSKVFDIKTDPIIANTSTTNANLQKQASTTQLRTQNSSAGGNTDVTETLVSEGGYQKIVEVYKDYKAKKLIPEDFPELTLVQLMNKLDTFEQAIKNTYPAANIEPLTDIRNYKLTLSGYFDKIRGGANSWFTRYLNPNPIVLKNNVNVYRFKDNILNNISYEKAAVTNLNNLIKDFVQALETNQTLGKGKPEQIKIDNLSYDMMILNLTTDQVDFEKTAQASFGVSSPTSGQTRQAEEEFIAKNKPIRDAENPSVDIPRTYFIFEGTSRFTETVQKLDTEANKKLQQFEKAITEDLRSQIEQQATGIGFVPSVRNIVAVIMATAEGFIRLLDEVHTKAWDVKTDPVRRQAIHENPSSANRLEQNKNFKITAQAQNQNQGISTGLEPVYPWPTFYKENSDFKKGRFQLTYLADPSVVQTTNGLNSAIWPEVEFVEEYIKGLAQKFNPPISQSPFDSNNTTFITNFNPLLFPSPILSYSNKIEVPFFYELYERQLVTSHYLGYVRGDSNQLTQLTNLNRDTEASNIVLSLGVSSPYLTNKLKNTPLSPQTYVPFLEQISNQGTGDSWQKFIRDRYVTSYLRTYTENPFSILKPSQIGPEPQKNLPLTPLQQLVGGSNTNTPIIVDKYPFTDLDWVKGNMELANEASYDSVYNTNKILTVYDPRDQVSNFENIYDYKTKRPVSNFSYYTVRVPEILSTTKTLMGENLKIYYESAVPTDFISTVGYVRNESPTGQLPPRTTSSILNSPIFINAILEGIDNQRKDKNYPYVKAAYLFLQSLPLATLRERYKSQGVSEPLDYIASCFNKFGAIHKVPYAWVLKLGAAWHRYKTFVNTGTDIIDSVWGDFDYVKNFDPIGNSPTRNYQFKLTRDDTYTTSVVLQNVTANNVEIQTGFYPKLYNEFYYFYTGEDLFVNYSNTEIQSAINGGLQLYQFPNSAILGVDQNGSNLNLSTWSAIAPVTLKNNFTDPTNCIPPDNTVENKNYLILPSFGANLNEGLVQLVSNPNTPTPTTAKNISSNSAMFNGTARCLWSASNYGYFDMSGLTKPDYNMYLTNIDPTNNSISPLDLSLGKYSTMEEIFSVFDTKTLDIIEQEFLKYCNPVTDINYGIVNSEIGKQLVQIDASARNFQAFMIRAMKVAPKTTNETKENFFNNAITEQLSNFNSQIVSILEYDVILRNGNPSNFNRYIWQSYLSYGGNSTVVDPIPFVPYTSGTLPTAGGTITLAQSRANNLVAWRQLELEVGFSTINQLRYSDTGSYITDFFVDNNIGFFNDTITILAPIIKMYATQKLLNPSITVQQFKNSLTDYLGKLETIQNQFLNEVLVLSKKALPNQSQLPAPQAPAPLSGSQARLELYQVFQSLNDKWISGTDYKNRTLFEDFLFLDRASRNIGQTIILDIFGVKNMISQKGLNENMSVFTLISGLLIQNNFTVMPLPAFTDFYNVRDVEGLNVPNPQGYLQFADELWGTYRVVDYRKATPKFVCFFVGKPSEQLNLPSDQSGYGDDSFELNRESEVPLIEDINGKTDYTLSNKCVGFNVDLGIRNQNVFSQINVSQNNGLATSESIQALLDMINLTKTRNTGTQNVSLYDFYKKRSYEAEITCLGNALIQPMMYFNLRHVPMFNGPYMITEVSHQIGPGVFNTTFKGTRQSIYDLPSIENYLQSINTNLLTKIEALIVQQRATTRNISTNNLSKTGNLITNSDGNAAASQDTCGDNLSGPYLNWSSTPGESQVTNITQKVFADALKAKIPNDIQLQSMIYILSYVRTYAKANDIDGVFKGFANNLANITLNYNYAGASQFFINGFYTCVEVTTLRKKQSYPIALFESLEKYIDFMVAILTPNQPRIAEGVLKYYVCFFPQPDISEDFYSTNRKYFEEKFVPIFEAAIDSARLNGINTDYLLQDPSTPNVLNNLNTNTPAPPVCQPTTITSFSPPAGRPGDIIELLGTALQFTRSITVAGQQVDRNTFQLISSGKIKFSVPPFAGTPPPQGPIIITSSSVTTPVTSSTNFVYL